VLYPVHDDTRSFLYRDLKELLFVTLRKILTQNRYFRNAHSETYAGVVRSGDSAIGGWMRPVRWPGPALFHAAYSVIQSTHLQATCLQIFRLCMQQRGIERYAIIKEVKHSEAKPKEKRRHPSPDNDAYQLRPLLNPQFKTFNSNFYIFRRYSPPSSKRTRVMVPSEQYFTASIRMGNVFLPDRAASRRSEIASSAFPG